jgi:hypothetical protein
MQPWDHPDPPRFDRYAYNFPIARYAGPTEDRSSRESRLTAIDVLSTTQLDMDKYQCQGSYIWTRLDFSLLEGTLSLAVPYTPLGGLDEDVPFNPSGVIAPCLRNRLNLSKEHWRCWC